jgi:putative lipoic acid-binding regulatory protein
VTHSADTYAKLRALLEEQETFPYEYTHKFIGKNTKAFAVSVTALEQKFPKARRVSERHSGDQAHVALTYVLLADTPDDVIALLQATMLLDDLKIVL